MNSTVPAAFLSYSHFDDEHDGQYITKFRELLEREVRAQTGRHDFVIFQDWRDIRWGQQWKERIEQTLDSASFLIPILSPSFFTSPECRREVERFLEREKALARNDLILPVYYIDSPLLSDAVAAQRDSLAQLFNSRQYFDWRPLRLKSLKLQAVRQAIISLAQNIRETVQIAPAPPPGPDPGLGLSQPDQPSYPGTHDFSITGQPSDRDERRRALEAALEAAFQQEDDLLSTGQDTTVVQADILNLQRQLREGHLKAGDLLLGRFKLIEHLGSGGFATIWKGLDRRHRGRLVAIKILHHQYAEDRSRRERFFRGARQMAALQHQGIVRVLEEELAEAGDYFFVMEYLAGGDFRRAVLENRLSVPQRLAVITAVGEALQFAHEQGVIHRDVKPANIVLDEQGRPKLTDFDLVRALDTTGGTRTGAMGTWLYAAPEVLSRPQDAGVTADVYGLAMTAVFALYGAELPFEVIADRPGFFQQLDITPALKTVLQQALAWKPQDRYDSVAGFCQKLQAALQSPAIPVPKPTRDEPSAVEQPISPSKTFVPGLRNKLKDDSPGPAMVWLPGGVFKMGQDDSPYDNEKPAHEVEVGPFSIGQYPVTFEEYDKFCEATRREKPDDYGWGRGTRPVINISWEDARAYCEWLSQQTGERYRLPTEAEWEYACRAASTTRYCYGDDEQRLGEYAWYWENAEQKTHPVGEKKPNAWRLYDLHGNVWEWVQDWYAKNFYKRIGVTH